MADGDLQSRLSVGLRIDNSALSKLFTNIGFDWDLLMGVRILIWPHLFVWYGRTETVRIRRKVKIVSTVFAILPLIGWLLRFN